MTELVSRLALVALGGAAGALGRYLLVLASARLLDGDWPLGTWLANVVGSFVIGVLASMFALRGAPDGWRLLWIVGVLGGFTTFSSFSLETVLLIQQHQLLRAGGYVLASVAVCLCATWLGIMAGRRF
ncbi:MAG: fluoride efflux transporter CrcB [Pseudomonadota bacterium]|nr:fluoride efflux transporter CrcB [Pseudomonadota bacterium]HJO34976.1 fluoride efflux transporter CrcB [Gammaproteobacteria bacterium]